MSFFSDQLLNAHAHDSQRELEKQRQMHRDFDEWDLKLKVYHPSRIRFGDVLTAVGLALFIIGIMLAFFYEPFVKIMLR